MKPEDVVYPFVTEKPVIGIFDHIWHIPKQCDLASFTFPGWHAPLLFGNDQPVKLEYCSGNGTWIAEKAKADPHSNWVAVEMLFSRVKKIRAKIANHTIGNLKIICGEAYIASKHYFPASSVQEVYINFPDPWPKRRHAPHRLIQSRFLVELERILLPGGTVTMVTDEPAYSKQIIDLFIKHPAFASYHPAPYFLTEDIEYGSSFFRELWESKGKTIYFHKFTRKA